MGLIVRGRQHAGQLYRRCAAPLGLRALERALQDGLPNRLEVPIRFLFTGALDPEGLAVRARVERRRQAIADMRDTFIFTYTTTPHGPARWLVRDARPPARTSVSAREIAHSAAVPERWGLFLYLCAEVSAAGAMIELGSSAGISSAYLASGRGCHRLLTLEGSPALAPVAQATLDELAPGSRVIQGPFDDGLDRAFAMLDETNSGIDLAYLDGHHDESPTVHYVRRLIPRLRPRAFLILDDIYLYADMWRAWDRIRTMPGVSVSVNLGRFGLLIWNDGSSSCASFDLSRYVGWWRVGGSRRAAMRNASLSSTDA